jgi:hypothetical protein
MTRRRTTAEPLIVRRFREALRLARRVVPLPRAREMAADAALRLQQRDARGSACGLCCECVHLQPVGRGWRCKAEGGLVQRPQIEHVLLLPHACEARRVRAPPGDPGTARVTAGGQTREIAPVRANAA